MIKKTPFNYSNDMDRRRQGLDDLVENLLPDVSTDDAGKIIKVGENGKWQLGDDENTIIEANPEEGSATEELENLKIGSTIYSVNKPTFDTIKGLRITTADGGANRTDRPTIQFYDDAGVALPLASSAYTASCDKSYAGSLELTNVCSIATTDAPGAYTYIFNNEINVDTYHLIKLTNAGTFAQDIAKSIKLELSSDGENFVTLWEDPAIAWSGSAGATRIIDIKTGSESSTILPIVTTSDNGKILGVVNGKWDTAPAPATLPTVSQSDNGSFLEVNQGGLWAKSTYRPMMSIKAVLNDGNVNFSNKYPYSSGIYTYNQMDTQFNYTRFIIEFDNTIDGVTHKELFDLREAYRVSNNEIHAIFKNADASHKIECVGSQNQTIDNGTATYT